MSGVFKYFFKKIHSTIFENKNDDVYYKLNDPNVSEEEKTYLKSTLNQTEHQPSLTFSVIDNIYKTQLDESWKGLKFQYQFTPNTYFNMDYSLLIEKKRKQQKLVNDIFKNINTSVNCTIPLNDDSTKIAHIMGSKTQPEMVSLQSHIILSDKDKLILAALYGDKEIEKGMFRAEYTKAFDRMNISVKVSNIEPTSISSLANVYKNLFVGVEAYKFQDFRFGYNYGLLFKEGPRNKLGVSVLYSSILQKLSTDMKYNINDTFYLGYNYYRGIDIMTGLRNSNHLIVSIIYIYLICYIVCQF
jgi:hypothetical protein